MSSDKTIYTWPDSGNWESDEKGRGTYDIAIEGI